MKETTGVVINDHQSERPRRLPKYNAGPSVSKLRKIDNGSSRSLTLHITMFDKAVRKIFIEKRPTTNPIQPYH